MIKDYKKTKHFKNFLRFLDFLNSDDMNDVLRAVVLFEKESRLNLNRMCKYLNIIDFDKKNKSLISSEIVDQLKNIRKNKLTFDKIVSDLYLDCNKMTKALPSMFDKIKNKLSGDFNNPCEFRVLQNFKIDKIDEDFISKLIICLKCFTEVEINYYKNNIYTDMCNDIANLERPIYGRSNSGCGPLSSRSKKRPKCNAIPSVCVLGT